MPRLQRATGHLKYLGRVTLRHPLALQVAILHKQVSVFEAIPALVAILIAPVRLLDDGSHSDLLLKPYSW
jgi:hypothetical protein